MKEHLNEWIEKQIHDKAWLQTTLFICLLKYGAAQVPK